MLPKNQTRRKVENLRQEEAKNSLKKEYQFPFRSEKKDWWIMKSKLAMQQICVELIQSIRQVDYQLNNESYEQCDSPELSAAFRGYSKTTLITYKTQPTSHI